MRLQVNCGAFTVWLGPESQITLNYFRCSNCQMRAKIHTYSGLRHFRCFLFEPREAVALVRASSGIPSHNMPHGNDTYIFIYIFLTRLARLSTFYFSFSFFLLLLFTKITIKICTKYQNRWMPNRNTSRKFLSFISSFFYPLAKRNEESKISQSCLMLMPRAHRFLLLLLLLLWLFISLTEIGTHSYR